MKKCSECNVEMIEGAKLKGKLNFEVGADSKSKIYLDLPTGNSIDFLGMKLDVGNRTELFARVCPKCGKVELYIEPKN